MKCMIAVGDKTWCVLERPEPGDDNVRMLQCLDDDERNQFINVSVMPGVYTAEYVIDEDDDGEFKNLELWWDSSSCRSKRRPQELVDKWNSQYEVGQDVMVKEDFKSKGTLTKTRSAAKIMGREAVIWLEGISGCYDLDFVTPVDREKP